MRIVGGKYRGLRLKAPGDDRVRPTTDRVREAIFNILAHGTLARPRGMRVLDMFAGTGAFGLEALSRGAEHATFIDSAASSLKLVRQNAAHMGVSDQCTLIKSDALHLPKATQAAGLVFADPPYGKKLLEPALVAAVAAGWIDADSYILAETASKDVIEPMPQLIVEKEWSYGQSKITRFSLAP
jgi:16S rRNA (guanine966-N2)-methyltransferase